MIIERFEDGDVGSRARNVTSEQRKRMCRKYCCDFSYSTEEQRRYAQGMYIDWKNATNIYPYIFYISSMILAGIVSIAFICGFFPPLTVPAWITIGISILIYGVIHLIFFITFSAMRDKINCFLSDKFDKTHIKENKRGEWIIQKGMKIPQPKDRMGRDADYKYIYGNFNFGFLGL